MKIRCWVCARFKEPSTWAALSVPLATWGSQMPAPISYYIYTAAAICGMMAIILKEGSDANSSVGKDSSGSNTVSNNPVTGKPLAAKGRPVGRGKKRAF